MSILEEKQFSSLLKEKIALFYQSMKLVCAILMVTFPDRCHLYNLFVAWYYQELLIPRSKRAKMSIASKCPMLCVT